MAPVTGQDAVPDLTCDEVREMAGAFVLGALGPTEDAAVRAHLATCADPHEEIAELGGVLPALGASVPIVEPPAGLKARIRAAAEADLAARGDGITATTRSSSVPVVEPPFTSVVAPPPASTVAPTPAPAVVPPAGSPGPIAFPSAAERESRQAAGRGRTSTRTWILRAVAVLAIVALGGWSILLQVQLSGANAYQQSVDAVLDVAEQPGSIAAILTPDGGTGAGLAAISASGAVTIAMQELAPTTGNTVYTAWAIGSDGKPVPLGSFKVGNNGTASFQADGVPTTDGILLALTRELGPGAQTPTMPIISKGVATAAG